MEVFPPMRGRALPIMVRTAEELAKAPRIPFLLRVILGIVLAAGLAFVAVLLAVLGLAVWDNLPSR